MYKHPLMIVACAFVLGIWYGLGYQIYSLSVGGIICVLTMIPLVYKKIKSLRLFIIGIAVCSAFLSFGYGVYHAKSFTYQYEILKEIPDDTNIQVEGTIQKIQVNQLELRNCILCVEIQNQTNQYCRQIQIYDQRLPTLGKDLNEGDRIVLCGKVAHFSKARNYGNFDSDSYYKSLGVPFSVSNIKSIDSTSYSWIRRRIVSVRNTMDGVYSKFFDDNTYGLIKAIVLGEKDNIEEEVKLSFQKAGIAHVLTVSGLHVSLLGLSLYNFLRKRKVNKYVSILIVILFLLTYYYLTGQNVSTFRALVMLCFSIGGNIFGRTYDILSASSIALCFVLIANPYFIMNTGVQLSFAAVLGVGIWKCRKTMGVGICLFTLPVILFSYYEMPVYGILLNMFILPLMSILVVCAFVGGVLGCVVSISFIMNLIFAPCKIILWVYENLVSIYLRLPGAILIVGKPNIKSILIYYIVLCIIVLIKNTKQKKSKCIILGIPILLIWFLQPKTHSFFVSALDVGQGDGTLIVESQTAIFVDGGSSDVNEVGQNRILPCIKAMGIQNIDCWFISHLDEDHYNGFVEVVESGYPVSMVIISEVSEKEEMGIQLKTWLKEYEIPLKVIKKNQKIMIGDIEFQCLWPETKGGAIYQDHNDASLALKFSYGEFRGLICGDLPSECEMKLDDLEVVDFYKCNHHGSDYSSCELFLEKIRPRNTTISCGKNNHYGHPGKRTIQRLTDIDTKIYDTSKLGQIFIYEKM